MTSTLVKRSRVTSFMAFQLKPISLELKRTTVLKNETFLRRKKQVLINKLFMNCGVKSGGRFLVSLGKPDTSPQPIRFNLPPIGLGHSRFPALLVVCLYPLRALIGVPVVFHSGSSGCCVLFCSFF